MMQIGVKRRSVLMTGFAATALAACSDGKEESKPSGSSGASADGTASPTSKGGPPSVDNPRLIGDGSTADCGPQPHQPKPEKLKPGQKPPQFVVISWDGAGENENMPLFERFLKVGKKYNCPQTWFLTGLFILPHSKRMLYKGPGFQRGASDVNFQKDNEVRRTIELLRQAWLDGHEIGTHYNGHFCGPTGVEAWSEADWLDEIKQAKEFVQKWKTNTGFTDLPPLPFDYEKELIGGRTPCLQGADNARKAGMKLGWRYDTSKANMQVWPRKDGSLWDLSLQSIPFAHKGGSILSMDYNIMVNQSGGTNGDPAKRPFWRKQAADTFVAGFDLAYDGNRAPLIIGNHLEGWNGGIYMDAVEDAIKRMAAKPDTKFVTFRQLCDWLDAQDPKMLEALRGLSSAPADGWEKFGPAA
ncbi:hypothetical protein J5M86_12635 [Yimella sp. cx-51]|uniref:hypothetical protein n=2 Tax=Yimella sp. cx-51 TaxID=2770551 RepID=UPI00165E7CF7|nr:hypothetical protein [Yimella sp. cx-51]MBC9955747.1 hypothetical protein [Yimella sp. cx-51]QTH37688.1 hypothetical protein J5M86_12635 [Yimella sp. cx-51]